MILNTSITGDKAIACVLGDPVGHSVSPVIHNTLSEIMGFSMLYIPVRVSKDSLKEAVLGLKAINALGCNVTVPHKTAIMSFIDIIDDAAKAAGAVNTISFKNGILYGYNTDSYGFVKSFEEETGTSLTGKRVVLLGAGGAARGIAFALIRKGASDITVINRTFDNALKLAESMNVYAEASTVHAVMSMTDESSKALQNADIIINTTSVGMKGCEDRMPFQEDIVFRPDQIIYDIVYTPLETKLLKFGEKCGCKTVNGLGMLVHQGVAAFEIWSGIKVPDIISNELVIRLAQYMKACEGK